MINPVTLLSSNNIIRRKMRRGVATAIMATILLLPATAQLTGDGTKGNPYKGSVTSNITLSGTIYYSGVLQVTNGTLTLSPGSVIIATTATSGIRTSLTGRLDARGTASSGILFTADLDADAEYGKESDTWGNITLLSDGPNYISYSTIENGRKITGRLELNGGGIHISSPSVTITNTVIRNCQAINGGGISVATGSSPVITGCTITGNRATKLGGGIYVTAGASPLISGSAITGNQSTERGGGIYVTGSTSHPTITECTITGNSSDLEGGAFHISNGATPAISRCLISDNSAGEQGGALYVANAASPLISNSVLDGNGNLSPFMSGGAIFSTGGSTPRIISSVIANSVSLAPGGRSVALENATGALFVNTIIWGGEGHLSLTGTPTSVFDHCAIEGVSLDGCITLASGNNDPAGPRFADPAAGNFKIAFASPCRDAGLSEHPLLAVPATDMGGEGRISETDIGAWEVRYSRWTGQSGTWLRAIGWEQGVIPGSTDIIIPSGKSQYPVLSPVSFTLNDGLTMIVEPEAQVSFKALTNNGTIDLQADAGGTASLMADSYHGSGGNISVGLFLEAGSNGEEWWHYIAAPATVPKSLFTSVEPDLLARYDETQVVSGVVDGWQWHDGYGGTIPFHELTAGEGYDVSVSSDVTITFPNLSNITTSLGTRSLSFSGSGGDTTIYGYSLLGNSLTCGINWDRVQYSHPHEQLRHAYYIRTASGSEASYVNGVGTNGATAHVGPLQGFFVRTRATGTSITFPDNAREHNAAPRLKSSDQIPLIRLTLSKVTQSDETVIRFDASATMAFDGLLDASKPFSHVTGNIKIYSEMAGERYSINSIPWPTKKSIIPLSLVINEEGDYTITPAQLQLIGNYGITLADHHTGSRTDLRSSRGYSFSTTAGTITGRFTLEINPPERAIAAADESVIKTLIEEESTVTIYSAEGNIYILPYGEGWKDKIWKIRIFDITGRVITAVNDQRLISGERKEFPVTGSGGLLIVEVISGEKRYLEKVVLTR